MLGSSKGGSNLHLLLLALLLEVSGVLSGSHSLMMVVLLKQGVALLIINFTCIFNIYDDPRSITSYIYHFS